MWAHISQDTDFSAKCTEIRVLPLFVPLGLKATMPDIVLRKHYMLTMRLDLFSLDTAPLQTHAQRLQTLNMVPSTLRQEQILNPDAVRQAYVCHNACRKQQPPIELRQEPLAFDKWVAAFLDGIGTAPELYFLALHEQQIIGVCIFVPVPESPDTLESGFTGVLPAWTGQGIARGLKALSLLFVKEYGYRYIKTSNLVINIHYRTLFEWRLPLRVF